MPEQQPDQKEIVRIVHMKRLNELIAVAKAKTRMRLEQSDEPLDFEEVFAYTFAVAIARDCFKIYDHAARNNVPYKQMFRSHLGIEIIKPWLQDNNGN